MVLLHAARYHSDGNHGTGRTIECADVAEAIRQIALSLNCPNAASQGYVRMTFDVTLPASSWVSAAADAGRAAIAQAAPVA